MMSELDETAGDLLKRALELVNGLPDDEGALTAKQNDAIGELYGDIAAALRTVEGASRKELTSTVGRRILDAERAETVIDGWGERSGLNRAIGKSPTPAVAFEGPDGSVTYDLPRDKAGAA